MKNLGFVVAGALLSLSAFAEDGVTLGGYVDAGYSAMMQDKVGTAKNFDQNGFLVREGAIYLGKKWGTEWEVFGDFAYFNTQSGTVGSNIGVAQAFVAQNMDNGFSWKLGRFDGIYGYYAGRVDSHAHRLTDLGYIQGAYLPGYHTGAAGSYSFSDMLKVTALVANDNEDFGYSNGSVPNATNSGTRHPDFGLLVAGNFDAFTADLGAYFMTGEDNPAAAAGTKSELGYVVSAVFEGNFHPLMVGVYGVYAKNDVNNGTTVKNDGDFGIGADAGYDVNDKLGLDLRVEYIDASNKTAIYNPTTRNFTDLALNGVNKVKNIVAGTIGGQWKFNDNVKGKVDYTLTSVSTDGAKVDPMHTVNAGVVANF